jgi:hypothetical protein
MTALGHLQPASSLSPGGQLPDAFQPFGERLSNYIACPSAPAVWRPSALPAYQVPKQRKRPNHRSGRFPYSHHHHASDAILIPVQNEYTDSLSMSLLGHGFDENL